MSLKVTGMKFQVIICSCLYLGPIVGGYTSSWTGPVIPKLRDPEQSPLPYLLTETQLALVGSFAYLGAIPGPYLMTWLLNTRGRKSCLIACAVVAVLAHVILAATKNLVMLYVARPYLMTWLLNTRGRKPCLIACAVVAVLAYVILAATKNLIMLYVARFLISVSVGSTNIVNFIYIGEIASPKIRGILLSIIKAMFTVGSILTFSTGPYISYRGTAYIVLGICVVHVISISWIPESPFFYAIQGKDKEVTKVLQDLGRPQDVQQLIELKQEFVETNTKKEWKELFTIKSNRKALSILVVINILQHCSGVMGVTFFSAAIFDMAGSSIDSNIAMIIIGCCQLMGSVVTPFFIETTGRKIILIISSATCSLSMFILGLYFYLDLVGNPVINHIKWLPLVILIFFYVGYDFGLGIIPNLLVGEMFTTSVRSKGSTVAMTSSWLCGFLVTTAFGSLLDTIGGHVAFWFFSCMSACAVLFTIFFIPETKGKTLLEVQEALS